MQNRADLTVIPLTALFVVALFASATASPFDGPRQTHSYQGEGIPLYPVPGEFSITWEPGIEEQWPDGQPAVRGPKPLIAGPYRLSQGTQRGPARYHTEVYQLEPTGQIRVDPGGVARELMLLEHVQVAAPLYRRSHSERAPTRAITPHLLLQLRSSKDEPAMRKLARELGLQVRGPRGLAPNQWLLKVPRGAAVDPIEAATALHDSPATRWAQVDWLREREARDVPLDPEFVNQWHHLNEGQANGTAGQDLKSTEAWDISYGSSDVIIAILDSGIDTDHPDLAEDLVPGYDFIDGDEDPESADSHGTKGAGAAAAPVNGVGVVGSCPECRIMPIRMLGVGDAGEADAHDFATQGGAWVINNSWGPIDGTGTPSEIPPVVAAAVDYATTQGRNGLGIAIFWAAGNGHPDDTCSDDGYVSYPSTIAIAASTNRGERAGYSEMCPELNLNAPSSGGTSAITTTTTGGDYSSSFGGTSAAAPVAAGVGGLILSALPELSWDCLRDVLQASSEPIDPGDAGYDENGHSQLYGYGRIDAAAAIAGDIGCLSLPASTVSCDDSASVALLLPGSPGLDDVTLLSVSDSEPGGELFVLTESGPGNYVGTIDLTPKVATAGDALLSVADGDVVTVTSTDSGNSKSFNLDCLGPEILVPLVFDLTAWTATITWQTTEPSDSTVIWHPAGAQDDGSTLYDEAIDYYHEVQITDLTGCTDYEARLSSSDALGNESVGEVLLEWTSPGDATLLPEDAIPGADPCDPSTWHLPDDDDGDDTPPLTGRGCENQGCSTDGATGSASPLFLLGLGLILFLMRKKPPTQQ